MTILGTGTLNSKIFLAKRVLDYILRVCKYYGYSLQELTLLFDSLIMSLFTMRLRCGLLPTMVNMYPKLIEFASGLCVRVIPANIHP